MSTPETDDCSHILRPDGIHVFRFRRSTRKAIDEWLKHLDFIDANLLPDETVLYLIDYQTGTIPPIVYGANQNRLWLDRRSKQNPARVAVLYHSRLLVRLMESTVRLLETQQVSVRFFLREAEAVAWLLET
jgi:hypothetical protein